MPVFEIYSNAAWTYNFAIYTNSIHNQQSQTEMTAAAPQTIGGYDDTNFVDPLQPQHQCPSLPI